ncbi:MAG TPA: ATP-binding protein, partial [Anaerolineales bacterium]|nr:ATP-binding protein [Anaerolineales bacterium]
MSTISNPYIGPRTFKEDERDRFYGREREADELLARVLSEQEVVFYAQSGAGKSSLVNTSLIPALREEGIEVLLGRVGGEVPPGLEVDNIFVFNLLRSLSTREVKADTLSKRLLSEFLGLDAEGRSSKRRALIIDQFEELFSTHDEAWEKRADFFKQVARALKTDPRLRVVLVMREDFIASLDPYARLMPGRFQARYYMQRLEYAAALKAVKEPVQHGEFSRPYEEGVAEKLVDDLRSVKVYKPGGAEVMEPGQYVEPVQLQVVCYNLWENLPEGGTSIREEDLQDVSDVSASFVSASLGKYYAMRVKAVAEAKQVNERKLREWFTEKLISPTGVRNMVLQERGGKSSGLENDVIQALPDLVRAETRGGAIFYELTHDRLVEPI